MNLVARSAPNGGAPWRVRNQTGQVHSGPVLLSNLYLHYVLDLWFERVVKPRLRGEAYLVRYIDDFVVCFQYREDAMRFQNVLRRRLGKFGLLLEPTKTKLVELGRLRRSMAHLSDLMRRMRHLPVREQALNLNRQRNRSTRPIGLSRPVMPVFE
ncbi:MAG TPA: hypothetical protein ENI62_15910 [Gammaproteobacteria bacterium]|nr:hypothetical protein [Gammaproteobacteria bacterium]